MNDSLVNSSIKEPSWDDILTDVRATLFTTGRVPSREQVRSYIFGKYGLDCSLGSFSGGSDDLQADVIITPKGTPRTLRIKWKKNSEAVIDYKQD